MGSNKSLLATSFMKSKKNASMSNANNRRVLIEKRAWNSLLQGQMKLDVVTHCLVKSGVYLAVPNPLRGQLVAGVLKKCKESWLSSRKLIPTTLPLYLWPGSGRGTDTGQALNCTAAHCTALHCTALQSTEMHCNAFQCFPSALQCTTLCGVHPEPPDSYSA